MSFLILSPGVKEMYWPFPPHQPSPEALDQGRLPSCRTALAPRGAEWRLVCPVGQLTLQGVTSSSFQIHQLGTVSESVERGSHVSLRNSLQINIRSGEEPSHPPQIPSFGK